MASKKDPYETTTVAGHRRAARLVRDGWEIVSTSSNFLAPARVLDCVVQHLLGDLVFFLLAERA